MTPGEGATHKHPRVTPSRVVLFNDGSEEYPGIVTTVHSEDCVNVWVPPDGTFPSRESGPQTSVLYDEDGPDGDGMFTWRWPPRV